jgi:clan AA aspartic protease
VVRLGSPTAKVTLHSQDMSKSTQIELLADTGSTYMWVSSRVLKELNAKVKTTRKFKTTDGRLLERKVDEVLIEYMNEKATRMAVFVDKGDTKALGVDALEGLGLEVKPNN